MKAAALNLRLNVPPLLSWRQLLPSLINFWTVCCHFELLLRIREKDVPLWMKKLSGNCDVSWSQQPEDKWEDDGVDETQVWVSLLGPRGRLGAAAAKRMPVQLCFAAQQRQVWHWHYRSPQHVLYGRVLGREYMHANCNQIPAGSRVSPCAAVRLQDDKATCLLPRTICLIACCLNIFSAFSSVCGERTLTYCEA